MTLYYTFIPLSCLGNHDLFLQFLYHLPLTPLATLRLRQLKRMLKLPEKQHFHLCIPTRRELRLNTLKLAISVGHLFAMDPLDTDNWRNPMSDFAYSLGPPKGLTPAAKGRFVQILTGSDGEMVPCRLQYATCACNYFVSTGIKPILTIYLGQGSKVCPQVDHEEMTEPHTHATRALLRQRLRNDREARISGTSPSRDVFLRTSALISAFRKKGCPAPLCEETIYDSDEEEARDTMVLHRQQSQRGYVPKEPTCEGRLQLSYDYRQQPYIKYVSRRLINASTDFFQRCEHYSKHNNKTHYINMSISDGSYDLSYLEALFAGDDDAVCEIEEGAIELGFGPMVQCTTVCNASSQRTLCRALSLLFAVILSNIELYSLRPPRRRG